MAEPLTFRIREIALHERPVKLRMPFRFGVVTLTESPQAFARARIELPDGRSAWGAAAELMAPKWFDKNLALTNEDNFEQLRAVTRMARGAYLADASAATAFGQFARHHEAHREAASQQGFNPLLAAYGPALVDRAVLDALCRALGVSFYEAMRANLPGLAFPGFDFDSFLAGLRPAGSIHARHTVGLVDAITASDQTERVGDGLPETLEEVVAAYGHRYFKLKVGGKVEADLARLQAIASVLDRSPQPYFASLDGNEQYESADGVLELVRRIRATPRLQRLWQSILFIEQPIARKLALDVDLRQADLGRPVIIDESDGELDSFVRARARGYSGVSSKTCKGFYKSVLNAARCDAWNHEEDSNHYFLSAEDLTTQAGLAVQQDLALVNLLGITHVERNGHHYVNGMAALPTAEQQAFLLAHPDLYEDSHGAVRLRIREGRIALGSLAQPGFASAVLPDFAGVPAL
ncbi:mandelate racemase [Ramlibacter sp. G-1-2-2]|uniref:Mandelate racemase n=1 Tax=Ramlibacter agri TaxID=2728837 RepID=A0A848H860_9BURK|nr:enolase C-terminal domain-like protein [Ramlibacter agri]NML46657.1 mandelate racemase [Ramlibacter agri]